MSRRRRLTVLGAALSLLALATLLLASAPDEAPESKRRANEAHVLSPPRGAGELLGRLRASAASRRRHELRREDPSGEPGPTPQTLRSWRRPRRAAEPIARRFHAAFSRYELGGTAAAELRRTATLALTRSLLRMPPRAGRAAPSQPARLGQLELLPLPGEGGRLVRVELVGTVRRGGRREPIALELRRGPRGWRVAGVGL